MKIKQTSKLDGFYKASALTALLAGSTLASQAADITWSGGAADYTNATSWVGGVVPGAGDNAINDNGAANIVKLSSGNPNWAVIDFRAGNGAGTTGAFYQDGPTATLGGWFRLGIGTGATGTYTLHSGNLIINNNRLNVAELGTGILNIEGGTIKGPNNQFALADGPTGANGTVNQTGGTVNSPGELWVGANNAGSGGNGAVAVYNMSGGSLNVSNWVVLGRNGTMGTFNMTGGNFTHNNNGRFLIASGNGSIGTFNHGGGSITCEEQFLIPDGGDNTTFGTYNISNGASLLVNNWLAVGRNSGNGVANITGGAITKGGNGGNHIVVGAGGPGVINQTGGMVTNITSDTWIGENSAGTWNLNGGTANLNVVHISQGSTATGTLNVNTGGTLITSELTTGNASAPSYLNLNGGVILAASDTVNFMHNIFFVNLLAGGVTIDTQGHEVTLAQALPSNGDGTGGLTKIGAGTLTLSGANSYSGATVVGAGKLVVNTTAAGGGNYTVADGAELSVAVSSQNAQLNTANLTLGATTGATVDLDLGNYGNPTLAPLNASGTLTVNGVVTLNITDSLPQIGEFPLIAFAAKTGSGSFALGTLPLGVAAHLNTTATSVNLVITGVNLPRWDGTVNGNWDIGTANWVNIGTGLATTYANGNAVVFNDQATGTTTVNLGITTSPSSVTFNNESATYTLVGTGKISGSTGLTKQGAATASVLNTGGNNFTGPVVISGGVLAVTNLANGGAASAIGAASASPTNLVLNGGALSYAGPAVTINRGYVTQQTNSSITTVSNLTLTGVANATLVGGLFKTGPAQLAYKSVGTNVLAGSGSLGYSVLEGSVLFDGSNGGQTNQVNGLAVNGATGLASVTLTNATLNTGDLNLGNAAGTVNALTVASGSTLTVGGWFIFGDGGNGDSTLNLNGGTVNVNTGDLLMGGRLATINTLNLNGGVFNKAGGTVNVGPGNWNGDGVRTGIVNQVAGTFNCSDEFRVGQAATGYGFYNLSGGIFNQHSWLAIGRAGSFGQFTITGGTLNKDGSAIVIGNGGGVGLLNQSGGTIECTSEYWVAENNNTIGTNNISGTALVNVHNWVTVGRSGLGVVNFSGGQFNADSQPFIVGIWGGSQGFWNQTGGALTVNQDIWIGQGDNNAYGTINLSGGTITNNGWLSIGREGSHGTLNISGGTMVKAGGGNISIAHGGGTTATINQTGGSFICAVGETWIGEDSGPAVWNISAGTATFGYVQLARNSSATGTLNLNGGTVTAGEITTGSTGTSTLNLNGGTLAAANSTANFLHGLTAANVQAGGVTIDSGANVIAVDQPLLDGTGGGGLTKVGNGTLYLNGLNTYTGSTLVNAGALGGSGTIAGSVNVAAGAKLAPGNSAIGTLTVNSLVLASSSSTLVKVTLDGGANNDMVASSGSVTYGGSLVVTNVGATPLTVGQTFHLFNAASHTGNYSSVTVLPVGTGTFDPATGILTITSAGAITVNPPTVSGGDLVLSGTGGTPGGTYNWLSATNVATPVALWTTNVSGTFGSTGAFTNAIPVSTSEPARFFRLKTP